MKVDVMVHPGPIHDFVDVCRRAADAGLSGVVVPETARGPFVQLAAAASHRLDLDLASGVAIAFPRSPMVTARDAWDLAGATGGRFRLGLGTQVRAHVERRFGVEFEPPGPRLRDYVDALRAIYAAFRGQQKLAHDGPYYKLSLLPPPFSPGSLDVPNPPIDVAGVNPWMLRMAGEVADGLHVHPFHTATYLEQTVQPNLAEGLSASGRTLGEFTVFASLFVVADDDEQRRAIRREAARQQIAFYGTTPSYDFVFQQIGAPEVPGALRDALKSGGPAALAAALPDEVLDHFVVDGTWADAPAAIRARLAPLGDADQRVVLYDDPALLQAHPELLDSYGSLATELAKS